MLINVIGLPGSGKTTLAKEISRKFNLEPIGLDDIFYEQIPDRKEHRELTPKEYRVKLRGVLKKNNLVIEGLYPITEVLEKADLIVRLKTPPCVNCLIGY